jgi:starvation-inducible DNA-binding protein
MDSPLIDSLKVVLADTFSLYLKAHNYHWNVTGTDFPQYHDFLNNLYNELFLAVDAIAEHIRAADAFVPGSYSRFSELTNIEDELLIPSALAMITRLVADNLIVMGTLKKAYKEAEAADMIGLSNFSQDRIDIHSKHGWMLKSIIRIG